MEDIKTIDNYETLLSELKEMRKSPSSYSPEQIKDIKSRIDNTEMDLSDKETLNAFYNILFAVRNGLYESVDADKERSATSLNYLGLLDQVKTLIKNKDKVGKEEVSNFVNKMHNATLEAPQREALEGFLNMLNVEKVNDRIIESKEVKNIIQLLEKVTGKKIVLEENNIVSKGANFKFQGKDYTVKSVDGNYVTTTDGKSFNLKTLIQSGVQVANPERVTKTKNVSTEKSPKLDVKNIRSIVTDVVSSIENEEDLKNNSSDLALMIYQSEPGVKKYLNSKGLGVDELKTMIVNTYYKSKGINTDPLPQNYGIRRERF